MQRIRLQCKRPRFNLWVGKIPGEGNGNPLQYSGLENSWTEEPGRLVPVHARNQSTGSQRVRNNFTSYIDTERERERERDSFPHWLSSYPYFHIWQQLFNTFQLNKSNEDFLPSQTPRFRLTEQVKFLLIYQ